MKRRNTIIVAATALAASVAAVGLLSRSPVPDRKVDSTRSGRGSLALRFPAGSFRSYRWSSTTLVSSGALGATPPQETVLEGRLNVRMTPGSARPTMAVQLAPLHVKVSGEAKPELEESLSQPFLIEIDEEGRFGESRFPAAMGTSDRAALDNAVRSLQVVVPLLGADRWETTETDQNGDFMAAYRREAGAGAIHKARTRYSSLRSPGGFAMRILGSGVRAEVDPDGLWLARSAGSEKIQIEGEGGAVVARLETSFTLEAAGEAPGSELAFWRDDVVRRVLAARDAPSSAPSAWDRAERDRQRAEMIRAGVNLRSLMDGLATHSPEDPVFADMFAVYLQLFPDEASRIPAMLGGLGDRAAALLFNILEMAGTPQAQGVLAGAMENGGLSDANRFRSLVAMTGLEHPTADTIERVSRATGSLRAGGNAGDLASTAVLVLGALSRNAPEGLGPRISVQLADGLRGAAGSEEQALYLRALENARADPPLADVAPYLRAESPFVRAAAVSVVAQHPGNGGTEALISMLGREGTPAVQGAVVTGLQGQPPNSQANEAVARALASAQDQDPMVRSRMVSYLGSRMSSFPGNRQVLQAALRRETNRDVAVAILNALAH